MLHSLCLKYLLCTSGYTGQIIEKPSSRLLALLRITRVVLKDLCSSFLISKNKVTLDQVTGKKLAVVVHLFANIGVNEGSGIGSAFLLALSDFHGTRKCYSQMIRKVGELNGDVISHTLAPSFTERENELPDLLF